MKLQDFVDIIKADRQIAIGVLVILVAGITVFYFARDRKGDELLTDGDSLMFDGDKDNYDRNGSSGSGKYYAVESRPLHLQTFDPNTADSTLLLGLGLQPWQVRSIYKYRAAGGVYTRPEDFARLYGLSVKKYRELRPYIRISPDYRPASEVYGNHNYQRQGGYSGNSGVSGISGQSGTSGISGSSGQPEQSLAYPQKLKPGQTISLNTSDTLELRKVPGIGPHFARKIARYRERLGGFVSKEQLLEIQDFPESALPYLNLSSAETSNIHRLNINKATSEQLRNHPYITYLMARQILDYRRLRGTIRDLNDLRLLQTFTPETIKKLRPYVEY